MASLVPPVVLNATARHTATLIFLHGLGDTGMGWAGALNTIRPPYMKVICPTAPIIPVTVNMGAKMPAWFDITSLDRNDDSGADLKGLDLASRNLRGMAEAEMKHHGITRNRVILGGFSQGGTVALHAILSEKQPYGAGLGLSTFARRLGLPGSDQEMNKTPLFLCHGTHDQMIGVKWARETKQMVEEAVEKVEYHEMEGMGHEATPQELDLVKEFIAKLVPEQKEEL